MRSEKLPVNVVMVPLLAFCWCLILFSPSAYGQANTGTILGTVTDPSGAVVPGAMVTATNVATGISKEFETNADGSYRIGYLIPGTYEVSVELTGFKRSVETRVPQVDDKALVNLTLEVGAVTESVDVTSAAPLLQTQSVEAAQVIPRKWMDELPLDTRDFAQLAILQTGAVFEGTQLGNNIGGQDPQGTGGAVMINGSGQFDAPNSWRLDGVSNTEPVYGVPTVYPSLDAIAEFKVLTNTYSAEYGSAGSANVLVQLKSGTNEVHGGVYEYLRNDKLDAANFFTNRANAEKLPLSQHQYGGFIGGPIVSNKTFFFTDVEVFRNRQEDIRILTIPSALQRIGDFTELTPRWEPPARHLST